MADTPTLDDALRQALAGVRNDDVDTFYAYFEELKGHVRRYLGRKAKLVTGETAVAQSALWSMFCDVAVQRVPLDEVDDLGYPMLWPLLLKYIERHCDKWNKFFQAKKRRGGETSFSAVGPAGESVGLDPADHRSGDDSAQFDELCRSLEAKLTPEEQQVFAARLQDRTLAEIAVQIGRSEGTVVNRLKRIRTLLESPTAP